MQVPVYNVGGEVVRNIEISDAVFAVPFNEPLVHQALVKQRADARQGTSDTKTRGEVKSAPEVADILLPGAGGGVLRWIRATGRAFFNAPWEIKQLFFPIPETPSILTAAQDLRWVRRQPTLRVELRSLDDPSKVYVIFSAPKQ